MGLEDTLKKALDNKGRCSFPEPQELKLPLTTSVEVTKDIRSLNHDTSDDIRFREFLVKLGYNNQQIKDLLKKLKAN